MLYAYFDESGTHAARTITLGGFMGPEKRWRRFERKWSAELESERITACHMTDLESLYGEFKGWDKIRAVNFQKRLLSIIKEDAAHGISCGLVRADYEALVSKDADPELPKKVGTHYGICAAGCIALASRWREKKFPGEPIAFVFEDGVRTGEVTDWLERTKKKGDLRIDSISFKSRRSTPPLQAADIHAYEAWKFMQDQIAVAGAPARDTRKSLASLFDMSLDGRYWDRTGLARHIENVRTATDY